MESSSQLHHKMCKKVAQLTKVIFYLNTKNDEYQSNLKAVVNAYENELDSTVKQANQIIQKYKQAADRANKNQELEKQLKKIQDNIERQKEKSYAQFEKYKRACEDKQAKQSAQVGRKMKQYEIQVEAMRGKGDSMSKTLQNLMNKLQTERKNHQKTMNDYVREQNQKYNTLMKKKIEIEEELNVKKGKLQQLEKLIVQLKKMLEDEIKKQKMSAESLLQELKNSTDKKIKDLEDQIRKAVKKYELLTTQYDSLKEQLKEKDRLISDLQNKIKKQEEKLVEKETIINNLQNDLQKTQSKFDEIVQNKKLLESENQELRNKISQLEEKLNLHSRQSSLKNGEFDSMRQQYERQLAQKNTEINMMKEKNNQLQKKIDNLGLQLAGLKDANDKNNSEKLRQIQRLKQTIEQLSQRLDSLQNNSSGQMKQLDRLLKERTSKFETEIKELISQYEEQIRKLHQSYKKQSEENLKKYQKNITEEKNKFEIQKARIIAEYEAKLKVIQDKLAGELKKMEDSSGYLKKMYEQKINSYEKQISQLKASLSEALKEIETKKKKLQELQNELEFMRKQKVDFKDKISKLQKEIEALKSDRSKLQGNLAEEIESLRKKITQQQYSYEERIRLMKKDHKSQMEVQQRLMNQRFDEDKKRIKDRYESEKEQITQRLNKRIKQLEQQVKGLSGRSEMSNSEWMEKLRKKEEEFQKILEETNLRHIEELKDLQVRRKKGLDDLKKQWQGKLVEKTEEINSIKVKELQALQEKKQKQKKNIVSDYEDKLIKLSNKFETDLDNIRKENDKKLKEALDHLENEKKNHNITRQKYAELQGSFSIISKEVESQRLSHLKTKEIVLDRQNQLKSLTIKMDEKIRQLNEDIGRLKIEYNYREDQLKRQNQKKIETVVNEQMQWTNEIKKQFNNMIQQNKNRIRLMEQQYQELKHLFDDRPSRQQDLKMIQKLQQVLETREQELKKAWHELKFFKLELINRQNNYNKMFNANPNVGILNPFQAKTAPGGKESGGLPSVTKKSIK